MKYVDYMEKLEALKDMAQHKRAGSPRRIAERFSISERTVQRMIEQLRQSGFPIIFDRSRNSYVFAEDGVHQ